MLKMEITRGADVKIGDQKFIGYSCEVQTTDQVSAAYNKVRSLNISARHAICAFRIPSTQFHTHQDFHDDDEHGAGAFLLRLMEKSEMEHRAIFVCRYYDGTHIGNKRYDAIATAAQSACRRSTHNAIVNLDQQLEYESTIKFSPVEGQDVLVAAEEA